MFHKHGGDIYSYDGIRDFSANINYRGMIAPVAKAAARAVADSVHYPDPQYRALRQALAKRERIADCQVICGNGAAELMFALAAAEKPRRALLAVPSFFEYEQALTSFGCEIDYFYLRREQDFVLEEAFAEAVRDETDVVVLGNPNNPTGQVIEKNVLRRILDTCRKKQTLLVLDESFFDFLYGEDRERTFSGVDQIEAYKKLFVLKSFTKMYAMPGLRFGYGICADQELLTRLRTVMQPWNVSLPAAAAAQAAAEETDFAAETARLTDQNRQEMRRWMEDAGYRVFDSGANFLLFTGTAGLGNYCAKQGFLIRDCSNFPGLEPVRGKGLRQGLAGGEISEPESGKFPKEETAKGGHPEEVFYRVCVRGSGENAALMEVLRKFKQEQPQGQAEETG